jgi:hypothetical protein
MSSDMNERPTGFRATICRVDGHPCEGQGTDADCNACQKATPAYCGLCIVVSGDCPQCHAAFMVRRALEG